MSCGKEKYSTLENNVLEIKHKKVLWYSADKNVFRFVEVDIHIPDSIKEVYTFFYWWWNLWRICKRVYKELQRKHWKK